MKVDVSYSTLSSVKSVTQDILGQTALVVIRNGYNQTIDAFVSAAFLVTYNHRPLLRSDRSGVTIPDADSYLQRNDHTTLEVDTTDLGKIAISHPLINGNPLEVYLMEHGAFKDILIRYVNELASSFQIPPDHTQPQQNFRDN